MTQLDAEVLADWLERKVRSSRRAKADAEMYARCVAVMRLAANGEPFNRRDAQRYREMCAYDFTFEYDEHVTAVLNKEAQPWALDAAIDKGPVARRCKSVCHD